MGSPSCTPSGGGRQWEREKSGACLRRWGPRASRPLLSWTPPIGRSRGIRGCAARTVGVYGQVAVELGVFLTRAGYRERDMSAALLHTAARRRRPAADAADLPRGETPHALNVAELSEPQPSPPRAREPKRRWPRRNRPPAASLLARAGRR